MEATKKKILIVDDDSFLLDMYALKFSQNNFEVYAASGGAEALKKLKDGLLPDVMLMDIIMPDMNGFEMLEKINMEKLCTDCIKIVLSNQSQQSDIDEGNRLGISGYITKADSTPIEVISRVKEILEQNIIVPK